MSSGEPASEEDRRLEEHLARAGEHLKSDRLDAAEQEVFAALAVRPGDLRARNLRGLILFRAGRHEEAFEVYTELLKICPNDAALRLNLGLVELRMGRYTDAARDLRQVVEIEPANLRAHGYLGLALLRSGDLPGARDAFGRAGQFDRQSQVEARMAELDAEGDRVALRYAANEGSRMLDQEQPFAAVELEAQPEGTEGSAQVGMHETPVAILGSESGAGAGDRNVDSPLKTLQLTPPLSVAAFATARLLRPGALGDPFALAEGGLLVIRIDGRLCTRTLGAIASTGQLEFKPLHRRVRGRASEESFGEGADAMLLALGHGLMVVAPRGQNLQALALSEDIVYLRESGVFSFEEALHWESGRIPGSEMLRVVQFRGTGRVVMRTARAVVTLKLESDATLFIEASSLVGWIGRVVPRLVCQESGEPSPYLECTGEGVLILEDPPQVSLP
jgi:uncharacterized protein (AIM24 family)